MNYGLYLLGPLVFLVLAITYACVLGIDSSVTHYVSGMVLLTAFRVLR